MSRFSEVALAMCLFIYGVGSGDLGLVLCAAAGVLISDVLTEWFEGR